MCRLTWARSPHLPFSAGLETCPRKFSTEVSHALHTISRLADSPEGIGNPCRVLSAAGAVGVSREQRVLRQKRGKNHGEGRAASRHANAGAHRSEPEILARS